MPCGPLVQAIAKDGRIISYINIYGNRKENKQTTKKKRMLARIWSKQKFYLLLVGVSTSTTIMEISMEVLKRKYYECMAQLYHFWTCTQ